jgi:flagellar biosynthesis protein FlhB
MPADDKTEAATPRRRKELRERGNVAKRRDLALIIAFIGVIVCLHSLGGGAAARLLDFVRVSMATASQQDMSPHSLTQHATRMGVLLAQVVGPIVLTAMLLGILTSVAQTGLVFATKSLVPDLRRLNPMPGFQRLVSVVGIVETLKAMIKMTIIGAVAYSTIANGYPQLLEGIRQDTTTALAAVGDLVYRLALRTATFLLVIAALDYFYQRWHFEKTNRMSKQEVKEEAKQQDANPMVKSRVRARQRQLARQRMLSDVPNADVILTNPTHFAVALKYDAATMRAPKVVAKGADLVAQRIRDIGAENHVPIIENPPLTRALFRSVEIGWEVPGEFYAAVAEVLAYVYQLNARRRPQGVAGPLRG